MLSAREAAARTGLSKAGIIKACRTGKISAGKNQNGEWEIDPVELFRVYSPVTQASTSTPVQGESTVSIEEHLRTQLTLQREIIEKQEKEIERLHEQLQERSQRVLLLEDKQLQARRMWWQWWRKL